ncbi:MAG: hypothetical protein PHN59_06490 [Candidatus Omnitrophica bacterium]|nr:hypothetical protein [Candidatus Omnitrophota bacterium]
MKQKKQEETKIFVAFSLNAAKEKIKSSKERREDFRKDFPEVHHLGYMSKPAGLVFDHLLCDTIIIGEKSGNKNLFLDDFVSALKSLYIHGVYPQLTIDPEGDTPEAEWHQVKMSRGIENSHFGQVFFESDYLLKKISLNLIRVKVPKFKTQYHLMIEKRREDKVFSRFWFKPSSVDLLVSDKAVFINNYPIWVLTETLSPAVTGDEIASRFSQSFSQRFDEFAANYPIFEDLQNLMRWVGISGAISSIDFAPDFKFWLSDYQIEKINIPQRVKGLNNIYGDLDSILYISGGVDSSFLNLRLKSKDASALKDLAGLVIKTRPSPGALAWEFSLKEYNFPLPPEYFSKNSDWLVNTSDDFLKLKKYKEALEYAEEALKINLQDVTAWYNKAEALEGLDRQEESIKAYEMFIKLAPPGDPDIGFVNRRLLRLGERGRDK